MTDESNESRPSVSTGTNLREVGLFSVMYRFRNKQFSIILGPDDIVSSRIQIEGRMREAAAAYLIKRDGNRCMIRAFCCTIGERPFEHPSSADFDHINGDRFDHHLRNLRLACHSCNSHQQRFQWKSKPVASSTHERKEPTGIEIKSDTVAINQDLWPEYEKWLYEKTSERRDLSVKDAIHESARELRKTLGYGSSETTRRYLNDLTAGPTSPFIIDKRIVRKR